ncbi:threonine synthase [Candidatus Acetothermia bacterium]|nr:MAG: threonine synthase [Candidatus Acetothermia bacterium]
MKEELFCPLCDFARAPTFEPLRCPRCGVPLEYRRELPEVGPGDLQGRGVWRYGPFLPPAEPVSLGEGATPLIESRQIGERLGVRLLLKLEGANPTGSFKDRGASVLVSVLRGFGVEKVADDSSGNAAAALAAYTARAGLAATLYVPAYASPKKLAQIEAYGAELVRVPGPRSAAEEAVKEAAAQGKHVYASHNESPYFIQGLKTLAYEIYEDLGYEVPDHVVVPLGGGGLFLGLYLGFGELVRLGWAEATPRIHAVQAEACAPVVRAFELGEAEPAPVEPVPTVAEGISIAAPARGREILAALKAGGAAVAVEEREILEARGELATQEGVYVEPTSAVVLPGLRRLIHRGDISPSATVVLVLTGSGLKGEPRLQKS